MKQKSFPGTKHYVPRPQSSQCVMIGYLVQTELEGDRSERSLTLVGVSLLFHFICLPSPAEN